MNEGEWNQEWNSIENGGVLSREQLASLIKERSRRPKSNAILSQDRIQFLLFTSSVVSTLVNIALVFLNLSISNSTKILSNTAIMQIRPFLEVNNIEELSQSADFGPDMAFQIEIKNFGQTAAINLLTYGQALIVNLDEQGRAGTGITYLSKCIEETNVTPGFLANGSETKAPIYKNVEGNYAGSFSPKSWEAFVNGRAVLFITGELCYKDLFRNQHFTKFCFSFANLNALMKEHTYRTCKVGNEFD